MLTLWRNTVYPTIAELTVEGLQTRAELPATATDVVSVSCCNTFCAYTLLHHLSMDVNFILVDRSVIENFDFPSPMTGITLGPAGGRGICA